MTVLRKIPQPLVHHSGAENSPIQAIATTNADGLKVLALFQRPGAQSMTKLLSVTEVRDLWPDPKPSIKTLKKLALTHRCCVKVGRSYGFRQEDVDRLLSIICSASTETRSHRSGMYAAPSPDGGYAKALELATGGKRKRTGDRETQNSMTDFRSGWSNLRLGAKR